MRKRYGLLTVHEASVPLERVQAIRVEESLPRRLLGLASLSIETAGGTPGQRGGRGGVRPHRPARRTWGGWCAASLAMRTRTRRCARASQAARRRLAVRYLRDAADRVGAVLGGALVDVQPAGMLAPWMALLLPLPWLAAGWAYRSRGWALPPGYVMARSGVLTRVTWIVPDRKLQTLHLRGSPFQRRHGLATVIVDTAAGGRQAAIIDLGEPAARRLLEELTDRVRAATRSTRRLRRAGGARGEERDAGDWCGGDRRRSGGGCGTPRDGIGIRSDDGVGAEMKSDYRGG